MKFNYHTHHELCKHAKGTTIDYVKEAIRQGFTGLGMSDHAPNPYFRLPERKLRMQMDELDGYLADVHTVKMDYKDKIQVYTGLEVEYFPGFDQYYQELQSKTDYLILGQHFLSDDDDIKKMYSTYKLETKEQLLVYKRYVIEGIESGYFDILAHPELYLYRYKTFDDTAKEVAIAIIKAAKAHNVLLEYNANGLRKKTVKTDIGVQPVYPRTEFWALVKQFNAKTILSSDCHDPSFLYDDTVKQAEEDYHKLELREVSILPRLQTNECE